MTLIDPQRKPREYEIVLHCSRCDYWLKSVVQNPKGEHGCTQCYGPMEVYFRHGIPTIPERP